MTVFDSAIQLFRGHTRLIQETSSINTETGSSFTFEPFDISVGGITAQWFL